MKMRKSDLETEKCL